MKKVYILGAMACMFASCKPSVNINNPISGGTVPGGGNVFYSNYMAVGSATTAGAADGTLYLTGQDNSYPERLFEQFSTISGSEVAKGPFIQPYMVSNEGYPNLKLVLGYIIDTCQGDSSLGPVTYTGGTVNASNGNPYVSTVSNGQINNIAVPGIRAADYNVAGYAALNPYAARFYANTAGTPMDELQHTVNNLAPTFFTFSLGEYDVLGYALAGGQGVGNISGSVAVPLFGTFYSTGDITPLAVFEQLYDSALHTAWSTGASGALVNIPDYTTAPFFTAIPANGLYLVRQTQADSLNAFWKVYLPNLPPFHIGYNYFIITDHNGVVRQAVPGEEILLSTPMANITCYGWGSYVAIPAQYVLTTDEETFIRTATTTFNDFIYQESLKYHLAYIDINKYLNTVATGVTYNGIKYSASFVSGGAYSLDGITFTPRGYALIANQIILGINSYYHATIPQTDVNGYLGIQFP